MTITKTPFDIPSIVRRRTKDNNITYAFGSIDLKSAFKLNEAVLMEHSPLMAMQEQVKQVSLI